MYLVTILLIVAFGISFWYDNRSLLNPILLLLSISMSYLSLANMVYQAGFEVAHDIFIGILFLVIPLAIFMSALFLMYNGVVLLRREGKSKANLLSLLMGAVILIFYGVMYVRFTASTDEIYHNVLLNIVMVLFSFSYFLFGFAFVAFMLYSILYVFIPKRKKYDFIIIHGAGLLNGKEVTPLLRRRIDKAIEAYKASTNPNIRLVASGGRGADEKISEAAAIAQYIYEQYPDIPTEAVLLEDQSTTTYENLLYSKRIGEEIKANPQFLFVTNDYHVFRTSMYAKQIGMKGDGLGCSTASYYIPSAFIREFVAVCVRYRYLFFICYAFLMVLLAVTYRGVLW